MASEVGIAIRAVYNAVVLDALAWVPDARDALMALLGHYTLAIVTNGPPALQWPKIHKFGIESLVDHVVVSGDVGVRKPDPAIFHHLLREAEVDARAAAHVGDSIHSDIAGARAAAMTAIWCPPRLRIPDDVGEHQPDIKIDRLCDLLD